MFYGVDDLGEFHRVAVVGAVEHWDPPSGNGDLGLGLCPPPAPAVVAASDETHSLHPWGSKQADPAVTTANPLVTGILTELDRAMPAPVLAELASRTADELDEVLDELDARLACAGLRLRRVNGEVLVRPASPGIGASVVRKTWRRHMARRSMDIGQARLVHRALHDNLPRTVGEDERLRGASLVNAGILDRTPSGGFTPSADVAFSLAF